MPVTMQRGLAVAGSIALVWSIQLSLSVTVFVALSSSTDVREKYSLRTLRLLMSTSSLSSKSTTAEISVSTLTRSASWRRKFHAVAFSRSAPGSM